MTFLYDATGISAGGVMVAPEGVYTLKIVDATDEKEGFPRVSKKGFPMVYAKCEIANDGEWLGTPISHWVTFMPKGEKGAGMAVNFLKTIGEPYENQLEVKPQNWIGKQFRAKISVEKDLRGRPQNRIAFLMDDVKTSDDQVPF